MMCVGGNFPFIGQIKNDGSFVGSINHVQTLTLSLVSTSLTLIYRILEVDGMNRRYRSRVHGKRDLKTINITDRVQLDIVHIAS